MKKILAALLLFLLCFSLSGALAIEQRVFDRAELFSSDQEEELQSRIEDFQKATGMDFVVVTSDEPHGNASQQQIADEFYDRGGFGLDEENSGILYYIDMDERYHYLSTTGKMIDYMNDERIDQAIQDCTSDLAAASYASAALRMIDDVEGYVRRGIPEGQYQYDVVTGKQLTSRHKALTGGEILGSAVAGLAVCLLFMGVVKRRYLLKGSTYSYAYADHSDVRMTQKEDTYLRTTTTQTRKPDPPQGNGGGSFGGGGGSGVHSSGGGVSHGGGGGHF